MKTNLRVITLVVALGASLLAATADDKGGHKHLATPKGGRLLEKTDPLAELVIGKDRIVTLNFYNKQLQPVAVTTQSVSVIAEAKEGKARLEFEKKGDSLVSTTRLPEGDGYKVVVQFKQTPQAKPVNLRFVLDLHVCGGCHRAEYACTCDH